MVDNRLLQPCAHYRFHVIPGVFALGYVWHIGCVPDFVQSMLLEIPPNRPDHLLLIYKLYEECGLDLRLMKKLVREAVCTSAAVINPVATADANDGPIVIKNDELIAIYNDEPYTETKENRLSFITINELNFIKYTRTKLDLTFVVNFAFGVILFMHLLC